MSSKTIQIERRHAIRVAVEVTALQDRPAGIGHYAEDLITALAQHSDLDMIYFTTTGYSVNPPRPTGLHITKRSAWKKKIPLGREVLFFLQHFQLERLKRRWRPEVVLGTNYLLPSGGSPQVLVVHDLSHLRNPETHPVGRIRFLNRHLSHSLERASAIVTISHFSKQELLNFFPALEGRVHVLYPGVSQRFFKPIQEETRRALRVVLDGDTRSYFLFLSTLEPRKNLGRLLLAYEALPEQIKRLHPLVMVGQMGWQRSNFELILKRMQSRGEVIMLGYVHDELLPALFERAVGLLYPSLYEGFGLPPIEAMACGCPVLVSNVTAMPEVCGDAALYCDPSIIESIRFGILQLAEKQSLRLDLVAKGKLHVQQYDWCKTGAGMLDILKNVARKK